MNWQDGDDKNGYRLWIDAPRRLLRFKFWGFWKEPLGVSYREACFDAMAMIARRGRWYVLADLSDYPAQKPEVQACHAATMVRARELNVGAAANLVSATLSQMQIRRLSEQSGLPEFAFFQSEPKALAYIDELNSKAE
jgi:serine/threonine-protein kinase